MNNNWTPKKILRFSLITIIGTFLLSTFVIYHVDCWNNRNKEFSGTIVRANDSMGKYSSTCLLDVDWDGIGVQVINVGSSCRGYVEGYRITVNRGWNPFTGKDGTAYIPEDPRLLSDNWIVCIGMFVSTVILVIFGTYVVGRLIVFLTESK